MRHAKLYRYQLPMDSGVILRDQKLSERHGWIVELTQAGKTAYGEIAPLPGFSRESCDEAGIQAQAQLEQWVRGDTIDFDSLYPSVAFGLSMAELELRQELPAEGNFTGAPLCTGDPDDLLPVLEAMPDEHKVAKVKVGLYEPIRDGMITNLFLETIPDLKLRLDANRAWTIEKAEKFASYINPSYRQRIEFIEEPCQKPGDSFTFAIDTGIAIAWDETLQESVRDKESDLSHMTGAKVIIIKPTLIGSVERCVSLVEQANKLAISVVFSSSLESSLGLCQLARMANWLTPQTIPGLDTIKMFAAQLHTPWPGSELPLVSLQDQKLVWQSL
ncbi:o-succinylbenzoate synthase [Vibrio sp. SCSIO 43137]|uniref:o-succinylbenzoate synthase n=1 Tax=Vibrio sp. SCSIO 43137 TaxID=3021011 RepID=UPI0023078D53|nr:o-succinylbenzoate synthase [Vibrio sp. SCSIO 43137]WCE30591.1 o-succinylbenzoate synthase [Vibrio sp. SCSIO 43137]